MFTIPFCLLYRRELQLLIMNDLNKVNKHMSHFRKFLSELLIVGMVGGGDCEMEFLEKVKIRSALCIRLRQLYINYILLYIYIYYIFPLLQDSVIERVCCFSLFSNSNSYIFFYLSTANHNVFFQNFLYQSSVYHCLKRQCHEIC